MFVCDDFIWTRYRGLIPTGDIFYHDTIVNIKMISNYGTEKIRSFLLYSYKRYFIISPQYHVRRSQQEEQNYRSKKSDFVFSENDEGKETTVYCRYCRYDFGIISKFDLADLLHQNRRYRPSRWWKQSSFGTRTYGNFGRNGGCWSILHRRTKNGGIWTRESRTKGDA